MVVLVVALSGPVDAGIADLLPNPLVGPGAGELKRSQKKKLERAHRELLDGDHAKSRKRLAKADGGPQAELLELQIELDEGAEEAIDGLTALCDRFPDYAAAWISLSIAAEESGDEPVAIAAARRATDLWPTSPWNGREPELHRRWVEDRIRRAEELLGDDDPEAALEELAAATAIEPERPDATLLTAKAYLLEDRVDDAEGLLEELDDEPEAVFLRASIAEDRGDWQAAYELYSALPVGYPERDSAVERSQNRWRLTLLPAYARSALESEELTRGELAVELVSLQPRLKTLPGGTVPVMSDIVDHPGHREIITTVRLGIMRADELSHLFSPDAPADQATIRGAIDRARALLGLPPQEWCPSPDVVGSDCVSIGSPAGGDTVARAMLDSTSGAER